MLRLLLFAFLCLPFAGYAAETLYGMPPEWFACKTTGDCGLILRDCGFSLAVNLAHKSEVEAFVDKNQLYPSACAATPRPADGTACEKSICSGTYSWKK